MGLLLAIFKKYEKVELAKVRCFMTKKETSDGGILMGQTDNYSDKKLKSISESVFGRAYLPRKRPWRNLSRACDNL